MDDPDVRLYDGIGARADGAILAFAGLALIRQVLARLMAVLWAAEGLWIAQAMPKQHQIRPSEILYI